MDGWTYTLDQLVGLFGEAVGGGLDDVFELEHDVAAELLEFCIWPCWG